jgi:FixJ family two-component response regulator
VKAMKAGAIDFLTKPFRDQDLLDAVSAALERDRKRRSEEEKASTLLSRFQSLKAREQEVMRYVTDGLMNKQIAHEMGLREITVKIHRGNVMRKMGARSLADLVRMSEALKGHSIKPQKT